MRKTAIGLSLAIFMIVFMLTACAGSSASSKHNKPKFESQDEMFAVLNGMWVLDEAPTNNHLIIHNDQIQLIDKASFKQALETVMYSTLENEGDIALIQLDFQSALDKITADNILENTYCDVSVNTKQGIVNIRDSHGNERQIVVDNDHIGISNNGDDKVITLKKVCETADFSGDYFQYIFNVTKENLPLPTDQFWMNPMSFGHYIAARKIENSYWWQSIKDTDEELIYQTNPMNAYISGTLVADCKATDYIYRLIPPPDNLDPNFEPLFIITYRPSEGKITIMDQDNSNLNLVDLVSYGQQAVCYFPGAYDDYRELYSALASAKSTISDGIKSVELTKNGLTYTLQARIDGSWAFFEIVSDAWTLGQAISATPVCSQCKKYEPDAVFYKDWSMGDACMECSGVNMIYCAFCDNPYPEGSLCDNCIP